MTNAQNQNIPKLRLAYLEALHDYKYASDTYDKFLKIENPNPQILAYRGALEAILTKTTWNPFKKFTYLKKSRSSLNQAVKEDPEDIEIRFIRMAVQYEIPSYLGFSQEVESDKEFIISNFKTFKPELYHEKILEEIIGFIDKCKYFSEEQTKLFKGILSTKSKS